MNRFIPVLLLFLLLSGCKKSESDFIWEKSSATGVAYFIETASDSGFYACGEKEGNPYFIRFNKKRSQVLEFASEKPGLFSSAWFDTSGYVTGGNSAGKILLMRYSAKGNMLWEKNIDAGFKVDFTYLFDTGHGSLLSISTASADSAKSGTTNLYFIRFDTTGQVSVEKKTTESNFVSATGAALDNAGNIYLPLTRKTSLGNPKASVAKYNNLFQKIWEKELYNNPDFSAASLSVLTDASGNIYVAGDTEVSGKDGLLANSFLYSLDGSGSPRWKKYLEYYNSGSAMVFDNSNNLLMLNKNCYIINRTVPSNGDDAGTIKSFSLCVSQSTNAFGRDIAVNYDSNILLAGSLGGNFYLALKSSQ
jgi:hypothetical protein